MKFYLAHTFGLSMMKVRKWQLMMQGRYHITFINPFFNNPYEKVEDFECVKSKAATKRYLKSLDMKTCKGIVENDLELIRKSDGVVAYFDSPSIGTCQEIIMAAYVYRIPVYIITRHHRWHPWLRWLANASGGQMFKTRSDFKKFVEQTWGKKE